MITVERAEQLSEYLNMDENRARELFAMSAEDACAKINADGYDYTADELAAFADTMDAAVSQEELNEDALDNVSGGIIVSAAATTAGIVIGAVALGIYCVAKTWRKRR